MKKLSIFILALCCVMLCACGDRLHSLSGKVMESGMTEEGKPYCIIGAYGSKETAVIITDETYIYSVDQNTDIGPLRERNFADTEIWAAGSRVRGTGITYKGKKIAAYEAVSIDIAGYLSEDTVTLPEGEKVNIWKYYDGVIYTAPDGTELLSVRYPAGPDNSYVSGVESLDDVDETARMRVIEFYEERGLLYDEMAELESAHSAFMKAADTENYRLRFINQDVAPSASNDKVMYFITSVMLPLDGAEESNATAYELRSGQAFDKTTGEHIDNFDLFTCLPKEAIQRMMDISGVTDPVLREEMEQTFAPECIILFPNGLEVCFNKGTLPSEEHGYMLGLDYDERLLEILQPWAVPDGNDK